ncbi:MAG TPA: glycoside hydrolase family 3 N-terminal domain-containing protein [Solirubrobacteraceae bacterium]|jgi:beta-N-acetylhexosaminidase|nr:glycoside hydrolase family 3 N-terminal domain-containing protein [Solirubrobacteraceae bacterium]
MGRAPPLRLVLVLIVVAILAGGLLALIQGPSHRNALPQGGSRFAETGTPASGESLLDALAPLLSSVGASAGGGSGSANPALARDVAQLFVIGIDANASTAARLRAHDWGGVVLGKANYFSASQLAGLTQGIRASLTTPPLILARQGGGESNAFPDMAPDSEPELGAAGRTDLVNGQSQLAARELRQVGVNGTLAPDADLADPNGPAAGRGYGTSPATVGMLTAAAVSGYRTGGLIAAVGHFPGEGAADRDPELGTATVGLTMASLSADDMAPFRAVTGDAPVIQVSDALYTALDDGASPATLLPGAISLLTGKLGFDGAVMSGDLQAAASATGGTVAAAAVSAVEAGCDLLYLPGDAADAESAYEAVLAAVGTGAITKGRLAAADARVAALKRTYHVVG